jgi:hypothetical protein
MHGTAYRDGPHRQEPFAAAIVGHDVLSQWPGRQFSTHDPTVYLFPDLTPLAIRLYHRFKEVHL